ncbi:MAG: hypothetical protein D6729_00235 [Deltaproteobacteria bacterium]|nr:MAG: hypothetical protein D6729_00235 [Deltaproteobacteria bacterium]
MDVLRKKRGVWAGALVLVLFALVLAGAAAAVAEKKWKPRIFHVHEWRVFVMAEPRRFTKKLGELRYLDPVKVIGPFDRGWYPVEYEGKRGYLPYQAITVGEPPNSLARDRVYKKQRGHAVQFAARGFGPDVEAAYRKDHPDLDFDLVDAMEAVVPAPERVRRFAQAGGLDIREPKIPPEPTEPPETEAQGSADAQQDTSKGGGA